MKKITKLSFAAIAALSLFMACSKAEIAPSESTLTPSGQPGDPGDKPVVTLTACLKDFTRVAFDPTYDDNNPKPTGMALTWEAGDKLLVMNHADKSQQAAFNLVDGAGTKSAIFSGTLPSGSTFDVEIIDASGPDGEPGKNVVIPTNGSTANLKYLASATDIEIEDEGTITLEDISSVLAFTVKMPSQEAAAAVQTVNLTANNDIFFSGKTLNIVISEPGSADDILHLYATLPNADNVAIPEGTTLIAKFNAPDTDHKVYTRYIEMGAQTFSPELVNNIQINASQSDQHAGLTSCDGTTAAKAYLIADGYQLAAMYNLATPSATTYFKMIDDVDMDGISYTPINTSVEGFSQVVDFNGNNKTISNLGNTMFYVFKGSARNLTLDKPTISNAGQKGAFAQYIQGTGHTIDNVDIKNVTNFVPSTGNGGGLIGRINSGAANVVSATITNCDVTNVPVSCATAGGLIGSIEAKVNISNCSYSGNTVTGTSQKVGGLIGIINDNIGCEITGCRVYNATVDVSKINGDARCGGFIGQLGEGSTVKGCTVGESQEHVTVKAGAYDSTGKKPMNTGGFVGVNYGTITKDDSDNHSKAYVTLSSANTVGSPINLGGFVGYQRGTISYSDAVVSMGTNDIMGQYIGGFAGYIKYQSEKTVLTDHCTVCGDGDSETVDIRGNNYTGGFVGVAEGGNFTISNCRVLDGTVVVGQSTAGGFAAQIKSGIIEDCSAHVDMQCRGGNDGGFVGAINGGTVRRCSSAGTLSQISSSNTVFGGFAGYVNGADLTKCHSTVNISVARSYIGGLIGELQTANTVSECYYNGEISGPQSTKGGLIGRITAVAAVIENCYTSGTLVGSSGTQIFGGIVGELGVGASVTNCYSTMDLSKAGRATGGIVGRACSAGWPVSNESNNTISKCIAWNPNISYDGTASASASSGAIVGYTSFKNILSDCYRRADMVYKNSNTATDTTCQTSMVDQVNCDGTNWAINGNRPAGGTPAGTSASAQYQAPYYGVAAGAGATVSSIAQTLGWDGDIWDFTGDLPTLK